MIDHALNSALWKPLFVHKQPINIIHLVFAIILFSQRNDDSLNTVLSVLQPFSACSSQQINYNRSNFFLNSTHASHIQSVCARMGMTLLQPGEKCLGIPISHYRSKSSIFQPLLHSFRKKNHFGKKEIYQKLKGLS